MSIVLLDEPTFCLVWPPSFTDLSNLCNPRTVFLFFLFSSSFLVNLIASELQLFVNFGSFYFLFLPYSYTWFILNRKPSFNSTSVSLFGGKKTRLNTFGGHGHFCPLCWQSWPGFVSNVATPNKHGMKLVPFCSPSANMNASQKSKDMLNVFISFETLFFFLNSQCYFSNFFYLLKPLLLIFVMP